MLMLNVFQDGAPLAGIRVKVAGRPAEEMGAGKYQLLIHEALGAPCKPLQVTIDTLDRLCPAFRNDHGHGPGGAVGEDRRARQ